MVEPYYEHAGIVIYHGDCREVLPGLEQVDLVLTDPPYTQRVSDGARTNRFDCSKSFITFDGIDGLEPWIARSAIEKSKRWAIAFCAFEQLGTYAKEAGNNWVRSGVWVKPDATPQFTGDRPAMCGEALAIMHNSDTKKRWNGRGGKAVWYHGFERNRRGHPTPKPEPLMRELVSLFSDADDLVLDFFMGSGTTLRAAKDLGRRAIGIELEERYCEIAAKRLSQEVLDFGLQRTI